MSPLREQVEVQGQPDMQLFGSQLAGLEKNHQGGLRTWAGKSFSFCITWPQAGQSLSSVGQ